jgi:hypothetical protein
MAIVPKAEQATRYADDFVIFSCGHAIEAMMWTKAVMTKLGLSLNEAKTSIRERSEGTLRVPWLLVRAALLVEEWPAVSGRKPVQEECAADQGEDQRAAGTRPQRFMA